MRSHIQILSIISLIFFFATGVADTKAQSDKQIALTFDDGPRPSVLKDLLPFFEQNSISATFFIVGGTAYEHPESLRIVASLGHEVENHSFGHENLVRNYKRFRDWQSRLEKSLNRTGDIIKKETGRQPRFFRPPFWESNSEIRSVIESNGYSVVRLGHPDINSEDYDDVAKHRSVDVLIARVKRLVQAEERRGHFHQVLVFHELPLTVTALKELVPYFEKKGYSFVRLDQIMPLSHPNN